jgi:hypothetical protein
LKENQLATPKIYSAKLSTAQNAACQKMESVSGLPPVGLEDLDAGHLTADRFWQLNMETMHDINATVQNISFPLEN